MYAVVRPGPHINAELSYFGLPERIVWASEHQAKTPQGNPVVLPLIPTSFPVPSYASEAFFEASAEWLTAVAKLVTPLQYPNGPVVLLQVDNEGAMYFRDGPYDQDYHPDSIRQFRSFLRAKYMHVKELRDAWQDESLAFATANPPHRFDATSLDERRAAPRLDGVSRGAACAWNAAVLERLERRRASTQFPRSTTCRSVKLPLRSIPSRHHVRASTSSASTSWGSITTTPRIRSITSRSCAARASSRAVAKDATSPPTGRRSARAFRRSSRRSMRKDSLYTLMCALAYGMRGFNLYMAVNRDRWVGAPIDVHGMPTPFADEYKTLLAALDQGGFSGPSSHRTGSARDHARNASGSSARCMRLVP